MKISLFQGIVIALFGLGALVGLFAFATYSGDGTGGPQVGSVVIWGTLPREDVANAITEINKLDNGLKEVSYIEKAEATLPSELAAAIATGRGPDLILASQEMLYSLGRFLEPISSDTLSQSAFISTFVDEGGLFIMQNGSGYYGLPILVDPLVLFWNNDILSSGGIAKPPATWEALVGLVPTLAVLTPSKQITRGLIGLGTYDNVHNARGILSALFLQTGTPITAFSGSGVFSADLGEQSASGPPAGQAVLSFYTQFADPAKISYTWNSSLPDSQQAFQTGDLALYLGYVSEARTLSAANPNLNYNVAPLPQPATARGKATYGLVYGLMIPRGAKNPGGAFEAAALFTNASQQEILARMTGLAPATRGMLSKPPSDAVATVAYASALYSKGWLSPAPAGVDQVFSSMIGSVVSGRLDTGAALNRAAGALTLLLQQ